MGAVLQQLCLACFDATKLAGLGVLEAEQKQHLQMMHCIVFAVGCAKHKAVKCEPP
jgi:hypothetical protein